MQSVKIHLMGDHKDLLTKLSQLERQALQQRVAEREQHARFSTALTPEDEATIAINKHLSESHFLTRFIKPEIIRDEIESHHLAAENGKISQYKGISLEALKNRVHQINQPEKTHFNPLLTMRIY